MKFVTEVRDGVKICKNSLTYFMDDPIYYSINRNLKISKALLKSQAHQGTSLFTSAATNQRGAFQCCSRECL